MKSARPQEADRPPAPAISAFSWGQVTVVGYPPFKDVKLFPGGARAWDWCETGTEHVPGIRPTDVAELLEHGARTVILSTGVLGRLQARDDTRRWLEERGVRCLVLRTAKAIRVYNDRREKEPVGALIHSTC